MPSLLSNQEGNRHSTLLPWVILVLLKSSTRQMLCANDDESEGAHGLFLFPGVKIMNCEQLSADFVRCESLLGVLSMVDWLIMIEIKYIDYQMKSTHSEATALYIISLMLSTVLPIYSQYYQHSTDHTLGMKS